jgi:hypothetical protein
MPVAIASVGCIAVGMTGEANTVGCTAVGTGTVGVDGTNVAVGGTDVCVIVAVGITGCDVGTRVDICVAEGMTGEGCTVGGAVVGSGNEGDNGI